MTWAAFFKSNSFTYGYRTAVAGLVVGIGSSYGVALKIAADCSEKVNEVLSQTGKDINIPQFTVELEHNNYSKPITVYNVNIPFPSDWMERLDKLNDLPTYCFYIPFTLGSFATLLVSLVLAHTVMVAVSIKEQQEEEPPAIQQGYMNLNNV